jgi:diguanylate cyclase (GGDEF)-like protein
VDGLLAYFGFLLYTMSSISRRVIEGLRLQLENAALAEELQTTLRHVERQATTDALTGQMNRRALDVMLLRCVDEAENRGFRFSILMLDVDHFKRINDTHGHPVGDQALRAVAGRVAAQLRGGDSCARYGGEEFVVLLPGTSLAQACEIGERIRAALASAALATTPPLPVTASIGVAEYAPGMLVDGVLAAADGAVYVAKRSGRNQVRSPEDLESPASEPLPASATSPDERHAERHHAGTGATAREASATTTH